MTTFIYDDPSGVSDSPCFDFLKLGTDTHHRHAALPALFISHGTPQLAVENNATTNALARIGQNLPKPLAIIIMSAHWVADDLTVCADPKPQTWHDFSGFDELAGIHYPAKGHQALAENLARYLNKQSIPCQTTPLQPMDHGVWSPLLHLYPNADVPVVQLSLPANFDAQACYRLGRLLAPYRHQQVLLIGSGNITHNLDAMDWHAAQPDPNAKAFKTWLIHQLKTDMDTALAWQCYRDIKTVHPTAEHLLPLFFAAGCGQRMSVVHESLIHRSLGMDIYRFD